VGLAGVPGGSLRGRRPPDPPAGPSRGVARFPAPGETRGNLAAGIGGPVETNASLGLSAAIGALAAGALAALFAPRGARAAGGH